MAEPSSDPAVGESRPLSSDSEVGPRADSTVGTDAPSQGIEDGARFHLAIFDDGLRSMKIGQGTLLIGRSKRNQLTLHDTLLSRKHCSLTRHRDQLVLADLNSSNGTFVNGERVGTRELAMDDVIELGKTVLVVFDGATWSRGEGLVNLRNPVKAQTLIQRIREGSVRSDPGPRSGSAIGGIRGQKGLTDAERAFLKWLEGGESRLLPALVSDYLTHKLVSLLVRNSVNVRAAFTAVLEEMLRPELFQRVGDIHEFREAIRMLVQRELEELREEECPPDPDDRGLLGHD
ncbi:MAG: FHA domain-containing protein [Planctomycetes bacterium]|nr:FHA domain-containing protein [Planctomycetota bacterium]